ncbi:MAG: TIGR03663 family protein [Chloroflexi bacterium]|nr:TIGR03663 family protein [Chloroflexota bacterium]
MSGVSLAQQAQGEADREQGLALLDRRLALPETWDWEKAAFLALVLVAALLRFWDLGSRALHHDESLHALYSWYLYTGRGYVHDPLMHGPFQFHAVALIYFLLGASDYTARILPALLGTAAVALPYFLRGQLGGPGAVCTAALLAFSPSMLYYSRFVRNDIYVVAWDLLLVIGMWRFMETGRRGYLILGAVALALAFSTKEVAYITTVIFGAYLLATSARELLPRLRAGADFRGVSPRAGFLITLGTLTLPLGAAGVLLPLEKLGVDLVALGAWQNAAEPGLRMFMHAGSDPLKAFLLVGGTVLALGAASCAVAYRWDWRRWLPAAGAFYGIFLVLYTTFFTNLPGFGTGIWGGLEYWLAQQEVQRGGQPWFYYLVLLPIYEFLPLLLSLGGLVYFGLRRRFQDEFALFLAWWLAASLGLYGYAGEKMPWLSLHIALPLILLAGKTLGVLVQSVSWRALLQGGGIYLGLLLPLLPLALRALARARDTQAAGAEQPMAALQTLAAAGVVALLLGGGWALARRLGAGLAAQTALLVALLTLAGFTLRTGIIASFLHGDIPVEMLVYTQTSPEAPRIMGQIERLAAAQGQGKNLPITVDATDGFTWPWAWYLRDYKAVDYPSLSVGSGEPRGAVLLLNANNQGALEPSLGKYEPGRRYPHRWWFPEEYRSLTLEGVLSSLLDPTAWGKWWSYLYARDVGAPLGSSDALVYYPRGSGAGPSVAGLPPQGTSPSPVVSSGLPPVLAPAEYVYGGAAGLRTPRGVALDGQGNLYVVEGVAARVTKFDPSGRVLAQVGRAGSGDGEFNDPGGVALDAAGNVYVADTWNHRVQKFDQNLRFLARWGAYASVPGGGSQNPGSFYGPRDVAVDAAGDLYVTDTGNKRVQKFSPDGRFMAAYGQAGRGPGQFQEPVGIAISKSGEILVADTWNRRVQRFDRDFRYTGEFTVAGWAGEGVLNKPFLAVDAAGNVVAGDPEGHRLLVYDSAGVLLKVVGRAGADAASFNLPAAITVDGLGRVYVADSGNGRVVRLPPLG